MFSFLQMSSFIVRGVTIAHPKELSVSPDDMKAIDI